MPILDVLLRNLMTISGSND